MNFQSITHKQGHSLVYENINSSIKQNLRILFLGGFKSSMQGIKGNYLSLFAKENNLNFLRFDYFGCDMSSGSFQEGTIEIIPFDYSLQLASKLQSTDVATTLIKDSPHYSNSDYALSRITREIMELYNSL